MDKKGNGSLGDFLSAELKANIAELNLSSELRREIGKRGISGVVADETVWAKTIDASPERPPLPEKNSYRDYPPSLYGW